MLAADEAHGLYKILYRIRGTVFKLLLYRLFMALLITCSCRPSGCGKTSHQGDRNEDDHRTDGR